jgi:hypothetical protein
MAYRRLDVADAPQCKVKANVLVNGYWITTKE